MPMNTDELDATPARVITFNGQAVTVPSDVTDIAGFVKAENRRRGITTFVAIANGCEIGSTAELDECFDEGGVLEIKTYAKPGALS